MATVFLCDFDDSFTYNIYSVLCEQKLNAKTEVISRPEIKNLLEDLCLDTREKNILILGPGHGHPDQYESLYPFVRKLLNSPHVFVMGVCLGHQIICASLGFDVEHSLSPVHGHTETLDLSQWKSSPVFLDEVIHTQRYNSLSVKEDSTIVDSLASLGFSCFVLEGELVILSSLTCASYQFHPESVGTSCPQKFFSCLNEFLL